MVAPPDMDERTRTRSLEERVSRLEGGYEHLATKADVERVLVQIERVRAESRIENERNRTEFRASIERVFAELERVRTENERNRVKLLIQLAGIGVALMAAGIAFLRLTGQG